MRINLLFVVLLGQLIPCCWTGCHMWRAQASHDGVSPGLYPRVMLAFQTDSLRILIVKRCMFYFLLCSELNDNVMIMWFIKNKQTNTDEFLKICSLNIHRCFIGTKYTFVVYLVTFTMSMCESRRGWDAKSISYLM